MADDPKNIQPQNPQMDLNPPVVTVGGPGGKETGGVEVKSGADAYITEVPSAPETEKHPELAGIVENVEKKAELPASLVDDYTGEVLLKSANPQNVIVTLPLTEAQVTEGLQHKVSENIRWLAEWCVRQIKLLHGKVKYRS